MSRATFFQLKKSDKYVPGPQHYSPTTTNQGRSLLLSKADVRE
jgi:hypothetical protein